MLTTRTPEAHAAVLEKFRKLKSGYLTPPSFEGTIVFPGFDGGAEWGGAAFDPESGLLFVNSNEMPWIVKMIPNDDTSLYNSRCASCHREDRTGSGIAPSLVDIGKRMTADDVAAIIRQGTGRMPAFPELGGAQHHRHRRVRDHRQRQGPRSGEAEGSKLVEVPQRRLRHLSRSRRLSGDHAAVGHVECDRSQRRARSAGRSRSANSRISPRRALKNTGSDNYGGPVVTASGLLFIGATNFDKKFRAYDKLTGELLWETTLPAAGNATPSIYSVNGREYIVIACGGGKNGAPSGSSIVAFALPR